MSTDRAFDKWHKAHRHIDRESARSAWDAGAHQGLRRNLRRVGWLHTMHMEFGQTRVAMTETNECPWGQRGVNFDDSYRVTSEQIFVLEMK